MTSAEALLALGLRLRGSRAGDLPLIVATWPRPDRPAGVPAREWRTSARRAALHIAQRARVTVLCSADHEPTVEGWAAAEGGQLVGFYLRPSYLRHGPSRRALTDALISHAKDAA